MRIEPEDRRYSNSTTITNNSEDADEGYFASVVTVQHSQKSSEQVSKQHSEWKQVSWPEESRVVSSQSVNSESQHHHQRVLHGDDFALHPKEVNPLEERPYGWINQVADSSHHLVSEAEMELQRRAFDVKHANDRSRSRSRSNFISERARSFERAQANGSEATGHHPPPIHNRRRRSPSLRRFDGEWINPTEAREVGQKGRTRWASVGRLDTSSWETRIRQESPAPVPPPERHRRRHFTGEPTPPRASLKDAKVSEWIRKSQDCLVNNSEVNQSHHTDFESSRTNMTQSTSSKKAESMSQHEEHLLRMEKEKRRQEYEIRQQTEELRRKDLEAKKKEMELNRRKEERQRAEQAAAKKAQEDKELERQAVAMAIREKEERQRAEMAAQKKAQEEERQKQALFEAKKREELEKKRLFEERQRAELAAQEEKRQRQALLEARKREELEKQRLFEERQKAELAAAQKKAQEEERLKALEARKQEELERQIRYEEQLKQKHMEEERRKEQKLLYEQRMKKEQEEQARLQTLQMEQRQERIHKQQQTEQNFKRQEIETERTIQLTDLDLEKQLEDLEKEADRQLQNHALEKERKALEREKRRQAEAIGKEVKMKQERDSRRSRTRQPSREARFNSQERQEIPRPITPINVKTGHVSGRRQFYNERSKSVDRKEETEPRRQRCHMQKDWNRVHPHGAQEESDPPSRPSSSLGQSLGAVKHSVDTWNHSGQEADIVRPSSRIRSTSHHRDWKPVGSERPITPTRFESVSTHQVQDTIKDWGHVVHTEDHSGRSTPVPSRVIGETFADSKVESREWNSKNNSGEEAPWRAPQKTAPEPNLKLVNISVTRNVAKEKTKDECGKESRNLFITELPDLPLQTSESRSFHMESKVETSCESSHVSRELPLPIATADSWFSREGKGIVSQNSSASTLAHLEGLKSPTETGKTPLPVLAGWYDKKSATGQQQQTSSSTVPDVQKYENDVDKRTRELEELRSMRADRNKRLQDAFELGDPYPDTEDSVVSYSEDGYSEEEESQRGPSKPAPSRRIGNLFGRSSDQWNEESSGPAPPQRNSSREFMKALNS